jgi:hypothetical protein
MWECNKEQVRGNREGMDGATIGVKFRSEIFNPFLFFITMFLGSKSHLLIKHESRATGCSEVSFLSNHIINPLITIFGFQNVHPNEYSTVLQYLIPRE